MIVTYNYTHLFSLMETGLSATASSKESLEYQVGIHFKGQSNTKNRIHLMLECVLPVYNAFGLFFYFNFDNSFLCRDSEPLGIRTN